MSFGLVTAAYIIAALFFIFSLSGLAKQETASHGNWFGIAGMAIALIATIFSDVATALPWIIIAMIIGGAIGIYKAHRVEMTQMPELIALLHSFVGLAGVLVGCNSFVMSALVSSHIRITYLVEVYIGVFIGAITLTGSIVPSGKLSGRLASQPWQLPYKHLSNLAAFILTAVSSTWYLRGDGSWRALISRTI